mgnify:CR=1 FL=1
MDSRTESGVKQEKESQSPDLSGIFGRLSRKMSEQKLECALEIMRRLPPQQCEKNLADLLDLVPELQDDLLSAVDQPLRIAKDKETGKEYLTCDYNRDGDSYRSPWTNQYDPPLEDGGSLPSERLRTLEIEANAAFEAYRDMYFEGGVSSAYFWEMEHIGFAGIILLKKNGDGSKNVKGCWDSIHVLEVGEKGKQCHYKLTSTVMLWLTTSKAASGTMNLGGSMTRQCEQDLPLTEATPHIVNIGRMIEEHESKMRMTLNEIYFGKTKKVVCDLRSMEKASDTKNRDVLAQEIRTAVSGRTTNA